MYVTAGTVFCPTQRHFFYPRLFLRVSATMHQSEKCSCDTSDFLYLTSVVRVIENHVRRFHPRLPSEDVLITLWSNETGEMGPSVCTVCHLTALSATYITGSCGTGLKVMLGRNCFPVPYLSVTFFCRSNLSAAHDMEQNDVQIMTTGYTVRFVK